MKEELVRLSYLELKQENDTNLIFFEFNVVGNRRKKYVTKLLYANEEIITCLCKIVSLPFYGVPFKFMCSDEKSYVFFALLSEANGKLIALSPCNGKNNKIAWIYLDESWNISKYISNELYNLYLSYKEITMFQTYSTMN